MKVSIYCELRSFESAHWLPNVDEHHKCRRIHGHRYEVRVEVGADAFDTAKGWVVDYQVVDDCWRSLHLQLDHHTLNEIRGLENPTAEHLAAWIFARLAIALKRQAKGLYLIEVMVRETARNGAICRG